MNLIPEGTSLPRRCPKCHQDVDPDSEEAVVAEVHFHDDENKVFAETRCTIHEKCLREWGPVEFVRAATEEMTRKAAMLLGDIPGKQNRKEIIN